MIDTHTRKLALLPDFREESWPSMDLCAEMLARHLPAQSDWAIETLRPRYRQRAGRVPGLGDRKTAKNADRLLNRWWTYPRFIRRHRRDHDWFHVVDHSYGHLVHQLPAERTGVFCHDLDAFRCLTQPSLEPRPRWFRAMAERILTGLQKAAVVFHSTLAVRSDILRFGLLDASKLVHAPYGVDEAFQLHPEAVGWPPELAALQAGPWLLHVGATIPRKRIDVLLDVFAALRQSIPNLRLCKIGGDWSLAQQDQIARHDLARSIVHLGKISQEQLILAYQRAGAVLITSDAEGFGLPVIEAMACGAPVVASDLPVLRESGGAAARFAPVADIEAWVQTVSHVLAAQGVDGREARRAWAAKFSWPDHARIIADAYRDRC